MYLKPYRLKRIKHEITCSKTCANILKSDYFKGEGNHQYGLIGNKNSSFKEDEIMNSEGYILEYAPDHPFPNN